MATLNTVFKQVFGDALEPLGFVKIKSKYPYFVRVVDGGEIIHVLTYRKDGNPIEKGFNILGGIATVYRQKIDLSISPSANINWLRHNIELYTWSNPLNYKSEFGQKIRRFYYENDEKSLQNTFKHSFEITEKFMIPVFDGVTDLEKCMKYFEKFKLKHFIFSPDNSVNEDPCNEGLLYIKLSSSYEIGEKMENTIANRNKIFEEPELFTKALNELETRRNNNTNILRNYGLNI